MVRLVCVVIFLIPLSRSHVGVILAPVWAACILPAFWNHFGWVPVKSVLEGMVLGGIVLERFIRVFSGRGPEAPWVRQARLKGVDPPK